MSTAICAPSPRASFSDVPEDRYTHGHHDSVLSSHRARTAENSAAYLTERLNSDDRLLDVGCGPGTLTADLAALVDPGEVVAVDREPAVLAEARQVFIDRGLGNVTAETADVYALDYDESGFDVVHAHQVLQHLSDPVAALVEMRRVVRPGGLVAVRDADYAAMTWHPGDARLDRWLEIYREIARANGAEPDAGRHLLEWAGRAGFSRLEPSASVWCFADVDSRQWWSELWAQRVTRSAVADQATAEGFASTDELAEVAEGFRSWATHPYGWFTVLHGEVLATR
jgi:ubiquinone/menaquinone biosynthesis C-methylase UbiE